MNKNEIEVIKNETLLETLNEFKSNIQTLTDFLPNNENNIADGLEEIEYQNRIFIKQLSEFQNNLTDELPQSNYWFLTNLINSMILNQININTLFKMAQKKNV